MKATKVMITMVMVAMSIDVGGPYSVIGYQ